MPRMPAFRTGPLRELAERLRFVPHDAARRQLVACERLADRLAQELVAPVGSSPAARRRTAAGDFSTKERWYPWAWVVGELTGFAGGRVRPALPESESDPAELIEGRALLADLCTLTEHLSIAARVRVEPREVDRWWTIEQLQARWGVSRRSIERWRAVGLHGRRVSIAPSSPARSRPAPAATRTRRPPPPRAAGATGSGARAPLLERVVFERAVVERFETRHGLGPDGPGRRIATADRARALPGDANLLALARRYARRWARSAPRRGDTGIDRFAAMIARRTGGGVSAETVRRRLRAIEQKLPEPVFNRASGPASRASDARHAWLARRNRLARVFLAWRAAHPAPESPVFLRPDAAEVLLAAPGALGVLNEHGPATLDPGWPSTPEAFVRLARHHPPSEARFEEQASAAYHFLLYFAAHALANPRRTAVAREVELVESRLLWASRLKARLLLAQSGLVHRTIETALREAATPSDARRASRPPQRLEDLGDERASQLLDAALDAASGAFERFDPFKGGRLAAPIALQVARAVSPWMRQLGHRAARRVGGSASDGPPPTAGGGASAIAARARRMHPWHEFLEPDARLREIVCGDADLSDTGRVSCRRVLALRWGWSLEGERASPPRSAHEVAQQMGVAVTTVRACERRAERALRARVGSNATGA